MSILNEILPGIYSWSEFSEEKQLNFNGYYLTHNGEAVLIDPPEFQEEGLEELETRVAADSDFPLKAILLTNAHHFRASQALKARLFIPVYLNELDSDLLEFPPDQTFSGGETVFGGLRVIGFNDQKTRGESAFYLQEKKILIVGDALIGKVPGRVNLLPPDKYKDIARTKQGLQVLRDYEFDVLLVGDGESILSGAKSRVLEFLDS